MNKNYLRFQAPDCSCREARFYFDYNPLTGDFAVSGRTFDSYDYKAPKKNCISKIGKYRVLTWKGQTIPLHRFVWFMYYGMYSEELIDHIDRDPLNIRINNLREVTDAQNAQNCEKKSNSKTGLRGVYVKGKRFAAKIIVNNEKIVLGVFDTPEEAAAAYAEGKLKYHIQPEDRPFKPPLPYDLWCLFDEDLTNSIGKHMSIKSKLMRRRIAPLSSDPDVLRWTPF